MDWNSKLTVAIFAAGIAGLLNVVVVWLNGFMQRGLEAEKAEFERILEMIKTGDPNKARDNLKFLADVGLVGKRTQARIMDAFEKKGGAPVLPTSNGYYILDPEVADSTADFIENSLNDYISYLKRLGFSSPATKPTIKTPERINDGDHDWVCQYDGSANEIRLTPAACGDPDLPRREYTHHALLMSRGDTDNLNNATFYLLESDVADYLVCSFADRPEFAPRYARASGDGANRRRLANDAHYASRGEPLQAWRAGSEVWGGALWALRQHLGPARADLLVARAWMQMPTVALEDDQVDRDFVSSLCSEAVAQDAQSAVLNILRERGFPAPP